MIRRASVFVAMSLGLLVSGCKSCCPFCDTFTWTLPAMIEAWWSSIAG